MKQIFLFLSLPVVLGVLTLNAQPVTDTLTLEKAVAMALENNHRIRISQLETERLLLQKKELKSTLMPVVEAYSSLSHFYAIPRLVIPGEIFGQSGKIPVELGTTYDWNSGLRFTQVIYHQTYFTSLKLVNELISLHDLSHQHQIEELIFQTSTLFHLTTTLNDQLLVFDSTIQHMLRVKQIVESQYENGIARKADVERVVIDISKMEIEKLHLNESFTQQLNLLKIVTGIDPDQKICPKGKYQVVAGFLPSSNSDVSKRTELQMMDKQRSAKALESKMERQSRLPVLTAYGQHYYQGMRDQFDFFDGGDERFFKSGMIGLQLAIPLFNGFAKASRIKIKEVELKQIDIEREALFLNCKTELSEALQAWQNSISTLEMEAQNLEAAKIIYTTNLSGYKQQVVSLTDLILSEYQLTKTRMELFSAQFSVQRAELTLRKITGTLTPLYF